MGLIRGTGRPPDFLIIGAQRSGTTSLFDALMTHAAISPPSMRELHYFDLNYDKSDRWYRSRFRRPDGVTSGESSPYYLFHPAVPARVAADLPGVRLIVLLRDPIDRAWSQHQFNQRTGREHLPFLEALAAESERTAAVEPPSTQRRRISHRDHAYAARGDYVRQLDRWTDAVDAESVLLLRSVDLYDDPRSVHRQVLNHLGLAVQELATPHANRGQHPLDSRQRAAAQPYFSYSETELIERYGIDYG